MSAEKSSTPLLDTLLHPMAAERFFRDYWCREFLHLPGPADKFAQLFSWDTLNRALGTQQFGERRLRLFRAKKEVPQSKFMNGKIPDTNRLRHHLAAGAGLILNGCDQLHAPLAGVCRELEEALHQRVLTNLYAGWRNESASEFTGTSNPSSSFRSRAENVGSSGGRSARTL